MQQKKPEDHGISSIIFAFRNMPDNREVESLIEALHAVKNDDTRKSIMETLVIIGDKRAITPLREFPAAMEKKTRKAIEDKKKEEWRPWEVSKFEKEIREENRQLVESALDAANRIERSGKP